MLPSKKTHPILEFWQNAQLVKTSNGAEVLMSCLECRAAVDSLLMELESKRNEQSKALTNLVCVHVLPSNFTPSCEDFFSMYLPTVLYMTYQQYSGDSICTKMHTCDSSSSAALDVIGQSEQYSLAAKNCESLQYFAKESFPNPRFHINAIAIAQEQLCEEYLPGVLHNLCYGFTEAVVPRFLNKIAAFASEGYFCAK